MAKDFVNAFSKKTFFSPARTRSSTESLSSSSARSRKHSSTTARIPWTVQNSRIRRISPTGVSLPVGLAGLHKKIISGLALFKKSRYRSAGREKSSSSFRGKNRISAPTDKRAASYSVNDGAVKTARLGDTARTIPKISSAAPFPNTRVSSCTP